MKEYQEVENKFVDYADELLTRFDINLDDLIDIIKDRCDVE